jgi:hypothetical protein
MHKLECKWYEAEIRDSPNAWKYTSNIFIYLCFRILHFGCLAPTSLPQMLPKSSSTIFTWSCLCVLICHNYFCSVLFVNLSQTLLPVCHMLVSRVERSLYDFVWLIVFCISPVLSVEVVFFWSVYNFLQIMKELCGVQNSLFSCDQFMDPRNIINMYSIDFLYPQQGKAAVLRGCKHVAFFVCMLPTCLQLDTHSMVIV